MKSLNEREADRVELQQKLDNQKTKRERNKLGQVPTPFELAEEILKCVSGLVQENTKIRFMDPAFGTGSFYSALLKTFLGSEILLAKGFEIDPAYILGTKKIWDGTPLHLINSDFTKEKFPEAEDGKPNLIVCNPPYSRHQHISRKNKERLRQRSIALSGIDLSGQSSMYAYFLTISHAWLIDGGLAIWLIPSGFMDVKYGNKIKNYLLNNVKLLRIHRYNPEAVQFDDALVSSAVVIFKKQKAPDNHTVTFTYGGTLLKPEKRIEVSKDSLNEAAKWTQVPCPTPRHKTGRVTLYDIFKIKRGVATGANDFFILTEEQIKKYKIPSKFLRPVLASPRYFSDIEIKATGRGEPRLKKRRFLLSCSLPEEEVKKKHKGLWTYLQLGIKIKVNQRSLCKSRTPWYSQEHRDPPIYFCTYMGRGDVLGHKPFRFILNHSRAIATNSYFLLYPREQYAPRLRNNMALKKKIWEALNQIPSQRIKAAGRIYGSGLHKVEPSELGSVQGTRIKQLLAKETKAGRTMYKPTKKRKALLPF